MRVSTFSHLMFAFLYACEKDIIVDINNGSQNSSSVPTYTGQTSLQLETPFFINKQNMSFGSTWGYIIPLDNGNFLTNAGVFNPSDFSWTADANSPDNSLWGVSLKKLSNGKIFLTSASQGYSIYDQSSQTWSVPTALTTNRHYAKIEELPNNKVIILGGRTSGNSDVLTSEIYDIQANTLGPGPSLTHGGDSFQSITLDNGKILIAGGYPIAGPQSTSELYDPSSNLITPTGSLNVPRAWFKMVKLDDGKILAVGGDSNNPSNMTETCELYDQSSGQWTLTGSLIKGRNYGALGKLRDGRVLTAAGYAQADYSTHLNSVEIYNPKSGLWTTSPATLNKARTDYPLFIELPNGDVVIAGGYNSVDGYVNVEVGTNFTEEITLSATGGDGSYTYTLESGPGKISGNKYYVGVAGIANIKVTDGSGGIGTFSINVLAAP